MYDPVAACNHAGSFWHSPCEDKKVWLPGYAIDIDREFERFGLSPADWVPAFLDYGDDNREGLFFVEKGKATVDFMISTMFRVRAFPEFHFVCSWPDTGKDTFDEQTPPHTGLNDCSHFVTECLSEGGIQFNRSTLKAPDLVQALHDRTDTKTLAQHVDKDAAARIIRSGVMSPGDVIAFATCIGCKGTAFPVEGTVKRYRCGLCGRRFEGPEHF
jgi:hypothetical protein